MCVPKIYEITPELVDRSDMIQILKDIVEKDSNAQVVANTIQSLIDLSQISYDHSYSGKRNSSKSLTKIWRESWEC